MKFFQNKITIGSTTYLLLMLALISCNSHFDEIKQIEPPVRDVDLESIKLSKEQALAYVGLFGASLEKSGNQEINTRSTVTQKEISNIDFCIENGDTLLFAINYKDEGGFCILKADNASFPIIAHSEVGSINFDDITEDSPLMDLINHYKCEVQNVLSGTEKINPEYNERWKDIGNSNFQYDITPINTFPENIITRARTHSTGKATVYPSTGKDLDSWTQEGNFNDAAPNNAAIGCPAVAIGMLLYDCNNRINGTYLTTSPEVPYWGASAKKDNAYGKYISKILKTIADSIPNYSWGIRKGYPSGAMPEDIIKGLHKLGFKNASIQNYDFETLYKNLSYKTIGYGGSELDSSRGVLLAGYRTKYKDPYNRVSYRNGHIWFCDGYYEQSFTVTKKFLFIKIKSWTEYDDRVYMNWGHGPDGGNGWYNATDNFWSSLDKGSKGYEYEVKMVVGLHSYENPNAHTLN